MIDAFPLITIEGSPQVRGKTYGAAAAPLIDRAIRIYRDGFLANGLQWDDAVLLGNRFARRIQAYDPAMFAELTGIAAGADRELGEIVALNARTELLYGLRGDGGDDRDRELAGDGCTSAIVLGAAAKNGRVLHAQNWDWRSQAAAITVVLRVRPETGPALLTLVEAGTLARCGLNELGLAITGNFLKTDEDFGADGIPAPFVRRAILNSNNLHDAMGVVLTTPRSFSINVMISDAGGEAVNFETTPAEVYWLLPDDGLLTHANHFRAPAALARVRDRGLSMTPDSLYREARVHGALRRQHGTLDPGSLKDVLLDDWGAPHAVCRRPSSGPGGEEAATLATVIMDVSERCLHVAPLPYAGARFWRYDLHSEQPAESTL